jgi:hypothetical protein
VSTLAGTGEIGHQDGDRVASAQFNHPRGVSVDMNGNVIVADMLNNRICRLASVGAVTPLLLHRSLPLLLQSSLVSDLQRPLGCGLLSRRLLCGGTGACPRPPGPSVHQV